MVFGPKGSKGEGAQETNGRMDRFGGRPSANEDQSIFIEPGIERNRRKE